MSAGHVTGYELHEIAENPTFREPGYHSNESESHAHTAVEDTSVERSPSICGPASVRSLLWKEQGIGFCLAHIAEIFGVKVKLKRAELLLNQKSKEDIWVGYCPVWICF